MLSRPAPDLRAILTFAGLVVAAVFMGLLTTLLAGAAGYFAVIYVIALLLLAAALYRLISAREPVQRVAGMVVLALPVMGYTLPPRRFGVSLLEVVMFTLMVLVIWAKLWRRRSGAMSARLQFFPTASLVWVQVLLLPSVLFSQYPAVSVATLVANFVLYLVFIALVHACWLTPSNDDLLRRLMIATLILGAGVAVDRFAGLNLALENFNSNQLTLQGGELITRARGFFGDPQKAAQFMACAGCFFTVLLIRGRFASQPRLRWLAVLTVLVSLAALMLTGSRASLVAAVLGLTVGFLLFNGWSGPVKLMSGLVLALVAAAAFQIPASTLGSVLPRSVLARFETLDQSVQDRVKIWFDTWQMIAGHPAQGIGLGSFRPYMADSSLVTRNFYGIGLGGGEIYIPDQPESGYFKILYEGGILGSLASMLVLVATVTRFARVLRSRTLSVDKQSEAIAAMISLAVFAITFVTLFTLSERRIVVLLAVMMALIWAPTLPQLAGVRPQQARQPAR